VTTTSSAADRLVLLDTHVWIWALEHEPRRIGRRTLRLIERSAEQDAVRVSPVTLFEVMSLYVTGRLHLSRSPEQWIQAALDGRGTRLAMLTAEAAIDAGRLGAVMLPDPLDRLLVATARQMGATLVTRDRRILGYATDTSAVRVQDAAR
jgi:PIN domain nuclease of toxin-antitoxin system